jgi:putative membrane protein insertion efficiency factor
MRRAVPLALALYRYALAPLLVTLGGVLPGTRCCKYEPSCSRYAADAVRELGVVRGGVLATWRLLRCNPWSHGGLDRVADRRLFRPKARAAGRPA